MINLPKGSIHSWPIIQGEREREREREFSDGSEVSLCAGLGQVEINNIKKWGK